MKSTALDYILIIPTLNAASNLEVFVEALRRQSHQPRKVLFLDSQSSDGTADLALDEGFEVHNIIRRDFDHGGTRQVGVELTVDADILVFLTQDAVLAQPNAVSQLMECFADPNVGAACGRQLPHADASPIASHARLFNYPPQGRLRSLADAKKLGIKTAFLSNSFAAYRRNALMSVGGFPKNVIFGEDTYVAAKMLLNGWKVAYCAEATVFHSHNYSIRQEFHRYFDIGVFHSREAWFIQALGKPEGEGKRFVLSEISYLLKNAPWLIPSAGLRTGAKLLGYKLGQRESVMPIWLKRRLSMLKGYWQEA